MNGVAAFANHGVNVFIFNVSFAVGFGFPHCAALGKDFKAIAITIIINNLVSSIYQLISASISSCSAVKIRARSAYSFCTAK